MATSFPIALPHVPNGFIDGPALDTLLTTPINDLAAAITDTGWITLPLASGYTSAGATTAGFRRVGDQVSFRGILTRTAGSFTTTALETVATLPTRTATVFPQNSSRVFVAGYIGSTASAVIMVLVGGSGLLQCGGMGGSTGSNVYLDCVSYMAA